jgi:hypothetical protein
MTVDDVLNRSSLSLREHGPQGSMRQGTPNGPAVRLSRGNPTRGLTESTRSEKGRQQHGESCEAVRLPMTKIESGGQLRLSVRLGKRSRQCASRSAAAQCCGNERCVASLPEATAWAITRWRWQQGPRESPRLSSETSRSRKRPPASQERQRILRQTEERPPVGDPRKLIGFLHADAG